MHNLIPGLLPDRLLQDVIDSDTDRQVEALRALVAHIDGHDLVARMIDAWKGDKAAQAEAVRHLIEHVNGFDRLTLIDHLPHYRLRLHIWWPERTGPDPREPDAKPVEEDAHDHNWDFASRVIAGKLRTLVYRPHNGGVEHYAYRHRYHQAGSYQDRDVERVRLIAAPVEVQPAGTVYTFDHRKIHRVTPDPDAATATIVATGRMRGEGSTVYTTTARHHDGFRQPATALTIEDLTERLGDLERDLAHPDQGARLTALRRRRRATAISPTPNPPRP